MRKFSKRLSLAMAAAGLMASSMTGVFAQTSHESHHPAGEPSAAAPAAPAQPTAPADVAAPMDKGGMGGMMGGDHMSKMMKMMEDMHGKMMGGGMAMQPKGDGGASSQAFNGVIAKMHQDMAISYSGNADVDFVKAMIPHHQGAVELAKTVLAFGKDPEVKKMAESVIKAQQAEIGLLTEWLKMKGQ